MLKEVLRKAIGVVPDRRCTMGIPLQIEECLQAREEDGDTGSSNDERVLGEYQRTKDKYLALCRRYVLNPFDLDILNMSVSSLPHHDKTTLVGLILRLIRLERQLKGHLAHGLFPLTVQELERSGYLVPKTKRQRA
jgi:hypothetical protein